MLVFCDRLLSTRSRSLRYCLDSFCQKLRAASAFLSWAFGPYFSAFRSNLDISPVRGTARRPKGTPHRCLLRFSSLRAMCRRQLKETFSLRSMIALPGLWRLRPFVGSLFFFSSRILRPNARSAEIPRSPLPPSSFAPPPSLLTASSSISLRRSPRRGPLLLSPCFHPKPFLPLRTGRQDPLEVGQFRFN